MSHSTTSRRGLIRGARRANLIASPPVRRASRSVRRRSGRLPSRAVRNLRVRRGGQRHLAHERYQLAEFGRGQLGEVAAAEPLGGRRDPVHGRPLDQRLVAVRRGRDGVRDAQAGRQVARIVLGPALGLGAAVGFWTLVGAGRVRQVEVAERRRAAEHRGEYPVEGGHLAGIGHHRGQRAGAQFGHCGGAHDRHRAGQPLAAVRADRQARVVQGDAEPGGHRGHIGLGGRDYRFSQCARPPTPGRPGARSLRPPDISGPY
jgi:hypothetical protein